MMIPILALYAGLLALLLLALSMKVVMLRRRFRIGLGSGNNPELERAIRAHANFVEYVPLTLLLLLLLELSGSMPGAALHGLGAGLLIGRVLHAVGLWGSAGTSPGRFVGTLLTWLVLLIAGIALVISSLAG